MFSKPACTVYRAPVCVTLALAGLLSGVAGCARAEGVPQPALVRIASDEWCPYVCVDKGVISGGFLVDAATMALQLEGYQVELVLMPFTRATSEVRSGNVQGVVASPQHDKRMKPANPIVFSRSCFYTRTGQSWVYQNVDSLKGIALGVIADYHYDYAAIDDYIDRHRGNKTQIDQAYGEFAGVVNLKKLVAGRFDALVEDQSVLSELLRKQMVDDKVREAGCADSQVPVTVEFSADDPHSDELVRALNAGLQQLGASGKLAALRQHYQIAQRPGDRP